MMSSTAPDQALQLSLENKANDNLGSTRFGSERYQT
jgi:hypothetical protein